MSARVERAIRAAFAAHGEDWMPIKTLVAALPGVTHLKLSEVLTAMERADEVVLSSDPCRMHLTEMDHAWAIQGRHLLHVRPAADRA